MNNWRDEFRDKYGSFELCDVVSKLDQDRLEAFIQSLLDQKAEEIEKLRKDPGTIDRTFYYNQALDDALTILKREE